jgi:hypothetical protein
VHDDEAMTSEAGEVGRRADAAAGSVMHLLAEHVPLTLLADLAAAEPRSDAILRAEGLPPQAWWEDEEGAPAPVAAVAEDPLPVDPDAVE